MLEKMQKTVKGEQSAQSTSTEIFQGFTTKALSTELKEFNQSRAVVVVSTQRLTYLGSGKEPNISYKKLSVSILKSGSDWKVDDAAWQ